MESSTNALMRHTVALCSHPERSQGSNSSGVRYWFINKTMLGVLVDCYSMRIHHYNFSAIIFLTRLHRS
jgi:hypothetical protein